MAHISIPLDNEIYISNARVYNSGILSINGEVQIPGGSYIHIDTRDITKILLHTFEDMSSTDKEQLTAIIFTEEVKKDLHNSFFNTELNKLRE